ncbi:MAG: hypothetical protein L6R38_008963 [Xanthoria sp. 2 TBL-2021]|nr:MAG: hypothetical protein L6R38_008963 [Xanthoria sp. 2 TBL-2021]
MSSPLSAPFSVFPSQPPTYNCHYKSCPRRFTHISELDRHHAVHHSSMGHSPITALNVRIPTFPSPPTSTAPTPKPLVPNGSRAATARHPDFLFLGVLTGHNRLFPSRASFIADDETVVDLLLLNHRFLFLFSDFLTTKQSQGLQVAIRHGSKETKTKTEHVDDDALWTAWR